MAPSVFSPNSLAWSALPIAVLLSYLWLKRKKAEFPSDIDLSEPKVFHTEEKDLEEVHETQPLLVTPRKSTRSLSGVESSPIDIAYPPELRVTNSNEYVPDEDLDTELRRASSTNIFDRYQAANQSVTDQKDPGFYKSTQLDQVPAEESVLESNIIAQNNIMTQFDTSNLSEANQPEQGDILNQSFQNEIMAHEHSHLSHQSSSQIESADDSKSSNYAVQLKEEEITPTPETSEEATTPAETSDEAYTPVETVEEVSSTVESALEVSSIEESSQDVTSKAETPEEVSLPVEIREEVSSTVEISEESAEIPQPVLNNVELKIENAATQTSQTEIIPKKTGAIPKTGKKKRQKFRPLPLETITGGKSQSYSRNKRRNERRPNYTSQSDRFEEEDLRKTCERASANSPTSASSGSISSLADSTDSGKGVSEIASPPACRLTPTNDETKNEISSYSFTIPHKFVGLLKGAQCGHINMIKRTAHVDIDLMITNPRATSVARKQQVCTIRGTKKEIDQALSIIKERFPRQRYPEITFNAVECPRPHTKPYRLPIQHTYLELVEEISNDTVATCLVAPDHLYLHLHLSPTYMDLNFYNIYMRELYSVKKEDQLLPKEIPVGAGCVADLYANWYRAQILSTDLEQNVSVIKLLDYGGIEKINNNDLRQYHCTLMGLPFQAIECYLYNLKPKGESWSKAATECATQLTTNVLLATHVIQYRGNIPEVRIYHTNGLCINDELVRRNFAEYVSIENTTDEDEEVVENVQPENEALYLIQ